MLNMESADRTTGLLLWSAPLLRLDAVLRPGRVNRKAST